MSVEETESNSIEYWKTKCSELSREYDEYRINSDALEKELDSQLQQYENRIRDLENTNNRLRIDNETITSKLNELNTATHREISQLQEELSTTNAVKDAMQKYITEIEQKNDHLENDLRRAQFSVEEFESQLTSALERNVMLEIQLDSKNELAETVQRLRDEARELQQELAVRQKKEFNSSSFIIQSPLMNTNKAAATPPSAEHAVPLHNNNNEAAAASGDSIDTTTTAQPQKLETLLKPSARISALNYVGDLLSKITSMESRLLSSRNLIKDPHKDRKSVGLSTFTKDTIKMYKREVIIPNTP